MCAKPVAAAVLVLSAAAAAPGETAYVNESARRLPVAYAVDVVVVGGGTGAVSAAVAAAEAGADVFLCGRYPYLGDDMTATLRLWLDRGEEPASPLARAIFADAGAAAAPDPNRIPFTYQADQPSMDRHKDTRPPSRLTDGVWGRANDQSVQYDRDVAITADLDKPREIRQVRVMAYYRASGQGGTNFQVASVRVLTGPDGKTWSEAAVLKNELLGTKPDRDTCHTMSAAVKATARYVKFVVAKAPDCPRVLLGEIEIIGAEASKAPSPAPSRPHPRPMHVKKTLDEALLKAGVQFLYSCYATDVLRDADGKPCGIVMANRAGRQAVLAKVVIDATERAAVARLAGARFRPYPAGVHTFGRVVIGGEKQTHAGMTAREVPPPFGASSRGRAPGGYPLIAYTLKLPMASDMPAAWAAADQKARTLTYHEGQQFTSDRLFEVPPDAVHGRPGGGGDPPMGAFRPAGIERLFVLGGCADLPREQAAKLLRPLALMAAGERVGKAAAAEAKSLAAPEGARLTGKPVDKPAAVGDVGEFLSGVRPTQAGRLATVPQDARGLPVFGRYDVVVIGGGTAGAPAGIAAGRQGAKVLVVEYLHGLGGVGTLGAIARYCAGNRVGFTATIPGRGTWVIEQKMEWYRRELLKVGADIWFGTIGCGAYMQDGRVIGTVVATPHHGRGVVLADVVVDATGNADVAAAAGAPCRYTGADDVAMQGTGLPPRNLGAGYTNTDFTITDETDMLDVWHLFVYAKSKYPRAFDQGQLIDTRERRMIVGEQTVTILDFLTRRTWPDTVAEARGGGYDTHGYTVAPYFMITHPRTGGLRIHVPYRCMLPKGVRGLLVTGIGLSAHRDAQPLLRMQPDVQNMGYAAGAAAALAAGTGATPREIDIRRLQRHLVEVGNVPSSVLRDKDSYPLPAERVAAAVAGIAKKDQSSVAVILSQPKRSLPLLRRAYAAAEGADKHAYAYTLAVMGDPTGADDLVRRLAAADAWDEGWNYRGMGQFGSSMSRLDHLIVALGRAGYKPALPAILAKVKQLSADSAFSHHRAVALALERFGDASAAAPLAALLGKPGMTGHVHATVATAREKAKRTGTTGVTARRESLRELLLARALFRCGDHQGLGRKVLEAYTQDLRGHLARHARAVLDAQTRK